MKANVQFFTQKGFYGEPVQLKAASVRDLWHKLDAAFDSVPDKLEGESFMNWTKITVEIER